jgi:hypothetical protein
MPGFRLVPGTASRDIALTPADYTPVDASAPWPVYDLVPLLGAPERAYTTRLKPAPWPDRAPKLPLRAARKLAAAETIAEARAALPNRFIKAARRHFGYND